MYYAVVALMAFIAGIIQGVTGFGSCIVMMMVFPFLFSVSEGAGIAVAITIFLSLSAAIRYRKEISPKKLLPTALLYIVVSGIAIRFSSYLNPDLIKRIFGVFLILLSVYFLFISPSASGKKLSPAAVILCIVVSAVCDGLFGIGGPLMVLVVMGMTSSTREYLGSILFISTLTCLYGSAARFVEGILGVHQLPYMAVGIAAILAGAYVAGRIVDKLDAQLIRKITYGMIGVAGIINLFNL